jgi:hypothetical protein
MAGAQTCFVAVLPRCCINFWKLQIGHGGEKKVMMRFKCGSENGNSWEKDFIVLFLGFVLSEGKQVTCATR